MKGMYSVQRRYSVKAPPAEVFKVITAMGGDRGWLAFDWLWRLRGAIDRVVGGEGFRRGRSHPDHLIVGDVIDFWRVEALEPDRLLRLQAEMILPGRGWLQFEIEKPGSDKCSLVQTAFFAPKGLLGRLYWLLLLPIHMVLFSRLIRMVALHAQSSYSRASATSSHNR